MRLSCPKNKVVPLCVNQLKNIDNNIINKKLGFFAFQI